MPFPDGLDQVFLLGEDVESIDDAGMPVYGWTESAVIRGVMRSLRGSERIVADDRKTVITHLLYLKPVDTNGDPYVITNRAVLIPAEVYDVSLPRYVIVFHTLKRDLFYYVQASEVHGDGI